MLHRKRLLLVPRKRCSSLRVSCLRITLDLCQWSITFIRKNPKRSVCYDTAFLWGCQSDGQSLGLKAGDLVMLRRVDATRWESPSDNFNRTSRSNLPAPADGAMSTFAIPMSQGTTIGTGSSILNVTAHSSSLTRLLL